MKFTVLKVNLECIGGGVKPKGFTPPWVQCQEVQPAKEELLLAANKDSAGGKDGLPQSSVSLHTEG